VKLSTALIKELDKDIKYQLEHRPEGTKRTCYINGVSAVKHIIRSFFEDKWYHAHNKKVVKKWYNKQLQMYFDAITDLVSGNEDGVG